MSTPHDAPPRQDLPGRATDVALRLAVVGLLVAWCFAIFRPFLIPLLWGVVLAVALHPAFVWIERATGGRRRLAAMLLAVVCLGLLTLPTLLLSRSLVEGARAVSSRLEEGDLRIPPAPPRVAQWPLLGPTIDETWRLASTSLEAVLEQFRPQVREFGAWIVTLVKQAAVAVLMTAVAVLIAAFLLARREPAGKLLLDVGARVAGDDGIESVRLAGRTIGTVAKGVVGVAAIQAALAALGLALAGIPGAGLWALIVLVLAVAQLPPLLVLAPATFYLVATDASTTTVVLFAVWSLVVTVSDGLLKPLLLGRGSETPVVVILIGAIGGLLLHGLIGLFMGAVVLSTGYRLLGRWLEPQGSAAGPA